MEAEKAFKEKINIDKAKMKNIWSIDISVISLLTYIPLLLLREYDFGMIFEIVSLVFLIIARVNMSKYDLQKSKISMIIAMILIGLSLIYDFINLLFYTSSIVDTVFLGYNDYYAMPLFFINLHF